MAELLIGATAATGFILLTRFTRARALKVTWWQWGITFLGFLYGVLVLEVVVAFLREGTPKGAAVMGTLMGFVAVVWGVLLGRLVLRRQAETVGAPAAEQGGGEHV